MAVERRRWTVDSVEEGIAAVHDGAGLVRVPAWLLPDGVREGDVVSVERTPGDGECVVRMAIDRAATDHALRRSREQVQRAAPGDPGGDIVL